MAFRTITIFQYFLVLISTPTSRAWGGLGHEAVAYVATDFVSAETKSFCQDILSDTTTSYLANVATWADTYRSTSEGEFSSEFHYIDAEDDPPTTCGVDYSRDCGENGCVVSAINNYTERVQDTNLAHEQLEQALKFVVHFIGDIHQPLHAEGLEIGGNGIDVTFDGKETNLHSVWDSAIAEKLVGGDSLAFAKDWATNLTTSIKSGPYEQEAASWLTGIDLSDPVASSLVWARDSNAYTCTTVIPDGASAIEDIDLGGAYYEEAAPVVQLQVAKGESSLTATQVPLYSD
ncbi:MAG: hypothetical protein M1837_007447 [Sclerophora amabilis]|nr:MAG: hypothetical protein M1837_007447 [Sclerophora amabilis]